MSLRVSGKNMQIGQALQEHAQTRVAAVVERYFDRGVKGHATLQPDGPGFRCELILHLDSGMTLQAEGRAQEPYATFDQASHRIETRLRRYKQRLKGRHDSEPASAETILDVVLQAPVEDDEEAPDGFTPVVVAESKAPFKTLSVADAVSELDMSGAPVLVFRHSGNDHVNIVYRRSDGHIGWIDPSTLA